MKKNILAYDTPGNPRVFTKKFSPIGPAVWPAIRNIYITGSRSTFEFPGQPFRSQFVLYLALWAGLAGATELTPSEFITHLG